MYLNTIKNSLLILCGFFFFENANAQDSNLYNTWYLYQLEVDLEGSVWDVEVEQPKVLPYLTINEDLTFNGIGACNSFSGTYTYDAEQVTLFPVNFDATLNLCDTSAEDNFEVLFFNYVEAITEQTITINTNPNFSELKLEIAPGYIANYRNVSLSISESILKPLEVYPNPVSNELNILCNGFKVYQIKVFDALGNLVIKYKFQNQVVNTSSLSKGIFFLEIESEKSKIIKKFIKY
jgi:heat shock protein HslJ